MDGETEKALPFLFRNGRCELLLLFFERFFGNVLLLIS